MGRGQKGHCQLGNMEGNVILISIFDGLFSITSPERLHFSSNYLSSSNAGLSERFIGQSYSYKYQDYLNRYSLADYSRNIYIDFLRFALILISIFALSLS